MIRWFKNLFHHHIYETIDIINKENIKLFNNWYYIPKSAFTIYVMRCKICGKIKRKKIKYF